jgi:hypothetical protein
VVLESRYVTCVPIPSYLPCLHNLKIEALYFFTLLFTYIHTHTHTQFLLNVRKYTSIFLSKIIFVTGVFYHFLNLRSNFRTSSPFEGEDSKILTD